MKNTIFQLLTIFCLVVLLYMHIQLKNELREFKQYVNNNYYSEEEIERLYEWLEDNIIDSLNTD